MGPDFVGIDFETANRHRGSICQIGLCQVKDGQIIKTITQYVKPHTSLARFEHRCVQVHGITEPDVADAEEFPSILDRLVRFVGDRPLVAHSRSVEKSMIRSAARLYGIDVPPIPLLCSLEMSKRVFRGQPSYSLSKLSSGLGLPTFNHHDAGEDAAASARLVLHALQQTGVTTLDELYPAGRRDHLEG